MATIDWTQPLRQWTFKFELVQPLDMSKVVGELEGVDVSSVSITEDYDSDTQSQAKLTFYGDGGETYNRNAFVRIVASLADGSYSEALGTFIPRDDEVSNENGVRKTTLTLESVIYGMSREHMANGLTIYAGASCQKCWRQILGNLSRQYRELQPNNRNYSQALFIDRGETYLDALFQVMDDSNNKLGVDGNGYVTIRPRTMPRNASETFSINCSNGTVLNGVSRKSNELSRPGGAVGIASQSVDGNEQELGALVTNENARTRAQVGYLETAKKTFSDLSPFNQSTLRAQTAQYMYEESSEQVEWTLDMLYDPTVKCGEVGSFVGLEDLAEYEGSQKVLCTAREINLETMTVSLTLKSVYSYYFGQYH